MIWKEENKMKMGVKRFVKEKKPKTFYFIKWWKSHGIIKKITTDYTDRRAWLDSFSSAFLGKEVFESEKKSREQIEALIAREIINLKKRIKKLYQINVNKIEIAINFKKEK
jgi:hypothetical protein